MVFHGFSWFLYNTSSCNRWADCHSSLLGLAEDHPPMFEQARGWMPNGKLQTAKLCTKQALARSNTIQEISCDYSSKMWFMRKEPQSSFCFSMRWIIPNVGQTFFEPYPLASGTITETAPSLLISLEADARTAARSMVALFCTKLQIAPFGSYLPGWIAQYSISLRESLPLISLNGKSSNVQVTYMKSVDLAAILCRWL